MTFSPEHTALDLVAGLVDDAGLFPPTALDMHSALARHREDQQAGEPMLTQRFLCPASRIDEMRNELIDSDRVSVGLIADSGPAGLDDVVNVIADDARLSLALVELPLAKFDTDPTAAIAQAVRTLDAVGADVPAFFEPASVREIETVATGLAHASGDRQLGAKLRCGGVRAELFPSMDEVAQFVTTCARHGVPFKATAGLHHAVRYTDSITGFDHHGYLNLLLAAALASAQAGVGDVRQALALDDGVELARRIGDIEITAVQVRCLLVSYGSCSTRVPVDEAKELLVAE